MPLHRMQRRKFACTHSQARTELLSQDTEENSNAVSAQSAPSYSIPSGIAWPGRPGSADQAVAYWNAALKPLGFTGMALDMTIGAAGFAKVKAACGCTLFAVNANGHGAIPSADEMRALIGESKAQGIAFDQMGDPDASFCAAMPAMLKGYRDIPIVYAIDRNTCELEIRDALSTTLKGFNIAFAGDGYSTGNAYRALCPYPPKVGNKYGASACGGVNACSAQTVPVRSSGCKCSDIVQVDLKAISI